MYLADSARLLLRPSEPKPGGKVRVGRNVVLLGLVSLLTDISSEMVSAVIPIFLFTVLQASPLYLGLIDGIYQGGAGLVRIFGGVAADRRGRDKEVATAGYGLSVVARLGLVVASGSTGAIGIGLIFDRIGKGIRTAPRDALISLSVVPGKLGQAFGVHRAMDTCGALLGPLIAFGILYLAPLQFDAVFFTSFCFGVLGLLVMIFFVRNKRAIASTAAKPPSPLKGAAKLLSVRQFRGVMIVGVLLSAATISDALLYVVLQKRTGFSTTYFPLLFVGTAAIYMLLAIPLGKLADSIGRGRVFIGGHFALLALYLILAFSGLSIPLAFICMALLGIYYAATDGVLNAWASTSVPEALRASGLAILTTGTSLARLLASISFGALWAFAGITIAIGVFAVAIGLALLATAIFVRPNLVAE